MTDFAYERELWESGIDLIGGIDEVGRGCFAGPVYTACVGFSSAIIIPETIIVKDSKKLTQKQREISNNWIKDNSLFYGIGAESVDYINKKGIVSATFSAMRKAVKNAQNMIVARNAGKDMGHILVDAFYIEGLKNFGKDKQTPIIKGDDLSISIAAASILAKVARDAYMQELGALPEFSIYEWAHNKGYGTKQHRHTILTNGTTVHHRTQFVDTFLKRNKSE